jgi:hypothetical protein
VREHGRGLWTFEDDTGQLYLAVLSREVNRFRQHVERERGLDVARRGVPAEVETLRPA